MALFAPANLIGESVAFTRLRGISAPAVVGAAALNGVLRGVGDPRAALDAAALAALINVFLDVVLVWQLGLNPSGAAIATACAEWVALIYLAARFAKRSTGVEALPLGKRFGNVHYRRSGDARTNVVPPGFLGSNNGLYLRHECGPDVIGGASGPEAVLYHYELCHGRSIMRRSSSWPRRRLPLKRDNGRQRLLGWGFVTGVVLAALALRDSSVLTHGRCQSRIGSVY